MVVSSVCDPFSKLNDICNRGYLGNPFLPISLRSDLTVPPLQLYPSDVPNVSRFHGLYGVKLHGLLWDSQPWSRSIPTGARISSNQPEHEQLVRAMKKLGSTFTNKKVVNTFVDSGFEDGSKMENMPIKKKMLAFAPLGIKVWFFGVYTLGTTQVLMEQMFTNIIFLMSL